MGNRSKLYSSLLAPPLLLFFEVFCATKWELLSKRISIEVASAFLTTQNFLNEGHCTSGADCAPQGFMETIMAEI